MATDDSELRLDARSVARLAAMRRLSLGAAHSLNNAFTSAIGEATYLLEERKEDGELVECCQLILEAIERSTRITRGLLARRDAPQGDQETDLGRMLSELTGFLRETLGHSHPLELSLPEERVGVKADPADIELVLTTLFQYTADASGEQSGLDANLEKRGDDARLTVQASACDEPDAVARALDDPELAEDVITRTSLAAVREIVASLGGSLHSGRTAPDGWAFVLVLPAL